MDLTLHSQSHLRSSPPHTFFFNQPFCFGASPPSSKPRWSPWPWSRSLARRHHVPSAAAVAVCVGGASPLSPSSLRTDGLVTTQRRGGHCRTYSRASPAPSRI